MGEAQKSPQIATLLWQPVLGMLPGSRCCGAWGALSSAGAVGCLRAVSTGSSPSLASALSGRRRRSPRSPRLCPCARLLGGSCDAPRCAASSPPLKPCYRGTACRCNGPVCAPTRCGCWRSALQGQVKEGSTESARSTRGIRMG